MDKKIIVFSGMPASDKDTITKLLCEEEEDARDYLKIMSYIGTAHEQGYNAYEAIRNAISGNTGFIFF